MVRAPIHTNVPARLDALEWGRWHVLIVIALGVTWVLDGLEVTLAGAVGAALKDPRALGLSNTQVGLSGTFYLIGAVVGALVFGYATDRFGRRKLFFLTLIVYVAATGLTALSWSPASYFVFRLLTGAGIGGEYAAINSAIDELIPARVRGHVDLLINSSFWLGAALGLSSTLVLLNPAVLPVQYGWRMVFGLGALLGLAILFVRNFVPESPRWLLIRGRVEEAEKTVADIERLAAPGGAPPPEHKITVIHPRDSTPWRPIFRSMFVEHRSRCLLALTLMTTQAFFYNAIGFFTLPLILGKFYDLPVQHISAYLLPFALGNLCGPILLGRLFDVVGRKPMIVLTYAGSGLLLVVAGWLFLHGQLTAKTLVLSWTAVFFIASCAASAAYLTISEIFPLEMRAIAISLFYVLGTLIGGVAAPVYFGRLVESGSRGHVFVGFCVAAGMMIIGAIVEAILGVAAEGRSLEDIASPLGAV